MSVKAFSSNFPNGVGNLRTPAGTVVDERQHEDAGTEKKYQSLRLFDSVLAFSQFLAVIILSLVGKSYILPFC